MTTPNIQGSDLQGSDAPAQIAPALMPRVNLMPPEIAEAARFRRFQFAMGGAVVAAVVIVGALYVHGHSAVKSANDELTTAKTQQTALQSQLNQLASVQDVYSQVAGKQAMLAQAMGSEIRWSYYLTDLSLKVPDNVWLTNVSATETGGPTAAAAAVAAAPAPSLTPTGIGSISFSGVAFSHDDVATWLDVLAKEHGWSDAYFTNSTESTSGPKSLTNFTSSVNLTPAAKSNRYTAPAGS